MKHGKVKTGHLEVAICIALPLVVILAIFLFGFFYIRSHERRLAQRTVLLNLVPDLEKKMGSAKRALKPFIAPGVGKDMAADLSLCVSDAAQKQGFAIRSSNVEKQIEPGAGAWVDYKLTLSGEGPLTALIATLDYLGQPQRRFHATQLNIRSTQLVPETMCSADLILVSRVVTDQNGNYGVGQTGASSPAKVEAISLKVGKATEGVNTWVAEREASLSLKKLKSRVVNVEPALASIQVEAQPQVSFRLTGVVGNKAAPMIMTDRGVFGVGDEVDGFKIESIGVDKVSLVSKSGHRETVRLYVGGGGM